MPTDKIIFHNAPQPLFFINPFVALVKKKVGALKRKMRKPSMMSSVRGFVHACVQNCTFYSSRSHAAKITHKIAIVHLHCVKEVLLPSHTTGNLFRRSLSKSVCIVLKKISLLSPFL